MEAKEVEQTLEDKCVEWARAHKVGTAWQDLTISQYVQDEEGTVYVAVPLIDIIKKDEEN